MTTTTRTEHGFTMMEIMVVVAVLAILTAIAVPVFINQRKAAYDTATESNVETIALWVETKINQNPGVPIRKDMVEPVVEIDDGTIWDIPHATAEGDYCLTAYNPEGLRFNGPGSLAIYDSAIGGFGTKGGACPADIATGH